MNVPRRTSDELRAAPALATLPVLATCIGAFTAVLDLTHPGLVARDPVSERESAAMLLHMHLRTCQELLRLYDHLTFDVCWFSGAEEQGEEPDDDIPF
jgi:hypothetical protein